MISLDKKILDPNSAVARRMVEYGKDKELFIIIPDSKKNNLDLSPSVHVTTSGGWCKKSQFFKLKRLGLKLIKEKQISEITTQDPFFIGFIGWCLKKKLKIPLEVQIHGDFFSGRINFIKYLLGKFVVHQANKVRVVGERVKQSLLKLNVAAEKIIVRPVPVDVEKIKNYTPKINLHKKYPGYAKIFLCLGRVDKVKNVSWLVDVFSEVTKDRKNILLVVVGDKRLDTDNIKFESWTDEPWSYIKTADYLLFPSLSEGYGLVAMEAYAAGTPVIMNDVGVANYELKPGDKVKILPINDKEKWIQTILNV